MTVYIDSDGWEPCGWDVDDPAPGPWKVHLAGAWHDLEVNGRRGLINVAGPDYVPATLGGPALDEVVVITADTLARVSIGGIIRTDEYIRLRTRT